MALELNEVPKVPVEIIEDGDSPIGCFLWFADELDAGRPHLIEVPPEIVRAQEEEDSPASLTADEAFLLWIGGACQEDGRASRSWRRDENPSFVLLWLIGVFYKLEMELAAKEFNGFVVVSDY